MFRASLRSALQCSANCFLNSWNSSVEGLPGAWRFAGGDIDTVEGGASRIMLSAWGVSMAGGMAVVRV